MSGGLTTLHETVRELCSASIRPDCDAVLAEATDPAADRPDSGRASAAALGRALRCALRHRRDAGIAVALAAATPHSDQDALDRSLLALLRASAEYHHRRCSTPHGRNTGKRSPCAR